MFLKNKKYKMMLVGTLFPLTSFALNTESPFKPVPNGLEDSGDA